VLVASPDQLAAELGRIRPRRMFFVHWNWKVPPEVIRNVECIGFHMTDLPFGRGGSPLQNLILRGHRSTMVTAFRLTEEMDAGPVYAKAPLALDGRAGDIYRRASMTAVDLMIRIADEQLAPKPQEGPVVTFERRKPEQSRLPEDGTPQELYDFIRMLDADGYPAAFIDHGRWRVELREADVADGRLQARATIVAREGI